VCIKLLYGIFEEKFGTSVMVLVFLWFVNIMIAFLKMLWALVCCLFVCLICCCL